MVFWVVNFQWGWGRGQLTPPSPPGWAPGGITLFIMVCCNLWTWNWCLTIIWCRRWRKFCTLNCFLGHNVSLEMMYGTPPLLTKREGSKPPILTKGGGGPGVWTPPLYPPMISYMYVYNKMESLSLTIFEIFAKIAFWPWSKVRVKVTSPN